VGKGEQVEIPHGKCGSGLEVKGLKWEEKGWGWRLGQWWRSTSVDELNRDYYGFSS